MSDHVLGPYRILDLVGRGGSGEVWRAEDTRLGRVVALKLLPLALAGDPMCRERLLREARAASRLNHPSIATIYEVDEIDGQVFISMEHVAGASLAKHLEDGPLELGEIVSLGCQIAGALAAAHGEGVIHRDIKPANILVTGEGKVKVVDFGIALEQPMARAGERAATQPTRLTASGSIVGTIAYMSPEQAKGATPDARSDIFSLGVVLYEMATGRTPFRGRTPLEVAASILHDPPAPVDPSEGEVPSGLRTILSCCLEKNPQRRPASAVQVADALEHLQRGSTTGSIRRALGRNPWPRRALVAGGIVGLVAASILLGFRLSTLRSTEALSRIHGIEAQRLYESAQTYEKRGSTLANFTLAEQMYRHALERDAGNLFLEGELARFLAFFEMEYLGQRAGRVEEIRKLSDEVLAKDPSVAPAWIARAVLLLLEGNTAGAEAAALRAIDIDERDPAGHLLLGIADIKQGRVEPGLDRLRKVVDTESGHLLGRAMLARALYDAGRMEEAAAEYRKLLHYAPDSPTALNNLAAIFLGRGNYVEAVGLLEQSLALQPDDFAAANLGSAYFYLGRMDESIAAYRKAVDLAPNQPTLKQNLAEAYEKAGKPAEAARWFEKAIDAYDVSLPRIVEGAQAVDLAERAFCEAKLHRFPDAYRDLDRALALDASDMNILRSAARVHATARNRDQAYAFVRRAVAAGYHREEIRNDPAFQAYVNDPEFLRLLTDPGGGPPGGS